MPAVKDTFSRLSDVLDMRPDARRDYEAQVASKAHVLDIGGRNKDSHSAKRLRQLSRNPNSVVTSTDILAEYRPDLVDDICCTKIPPGSFDGVYCNAVLEHVTEYWKAIENIHSVLIKGGEAFVYVPFFYQYHDRMDYHRFTVTELARMLQSFSEVRVFVPEGHSGYGYVLWSIVTFARINRYARLHSSLARATNHLLSCLLFCIYCTRLRDYSFHQFDYYFKYLYINHGFCAWVRK